MNQILSSTLDLLPSERSLLLAMQRLGFGRFEAIPVRGGEVILEPWPKTVQGIKFTSAGSSPLNLLPEPFQLRRQVIELLEYVRGTEYGEMHCLEVRHGLPFSMEVEMAGAEMTTTGVCHQ